MMQASVYVPEVRGKTVEEAARILKEAGLSIRRKPAGIMIILWKPPFWSKRRNRARLYLKVNCDIIYLQAREEVKAPVPKLTGMTIAEASSALNEVGLNISIDGMGTSVSQEFEAGTFYRKVRWLRLHSGIWTTWSKREVYKEMKLCEIIEGLEPTVVNGREYGHPGDCLRLTESQGRLPVCLY